MNRIIAVSIAMLVLIIAFIFILVNGPCRCQPIRIDQSDGVGTFVSFSTDPVLMPNDPEVAPARIRARGGEKVTWVIRNPSNRDITVGLHSVIEHDPSRNIRDEVFEDIDPPVRIDRGCQIAALQGRLFRDLLRDSSRYDTCDSSRVFHYFFMIRVLESTSGKGDTTVCEFPYDPELVVERDP